MITLSVIITFYKDENFIEKLENRLLKKKIITLLRYPLLKKFKITEGKKIKTSDFFAYIKNILIFRVRYA